MSKYRITVDGGTGKAGKGVGKIEITDRGVEVDVKTGDGMHDRRTIPFQAIASVGLKKPFMAGQAEVALVGSDGGDLFRFLTMRRKSADEIITLINEGMQAS